MRIVLLILCIPAFLCGFVTLVAAKSAVHEIEAGIAFLIGAMFLAGASICDAISACSGKLEKVLRQLEMQLMRDRTGTAAPHARPVSDEEQAFHRGREDETRKG